MTRDFAAFDGDNSIWRDQRKRVPWDQRLKLIQQEFPSVVDPKWNVILRDMDVFGRILRDILKVDQIEPGRAGPRPNLNYERGMQTWREITGQDFSELPFPEAFKILARGDSYTKIARKTGLSRSHIYRLMQGWEHPTVDELRACAAAYNKKPGYFAEYRSEFILAAIATRLANETEMSIAVYMNIIRATP